MPNPIVKTLTIDGTTYDLSGIPLSHTHGNITNNGTLQTTDITIANGDKLVVTDSSDSNKVARTSISFDALTDSKVLSKKGTWVDLPSGVSPYTSDPKMDGTASAGSSTLYAKGDHVHPTDTSRAPLASPALTGTPTAPTAAVSTDTTQIATTKFVHDVVDGLPTPMQFMGTVGTGGIETWETLPTASNHTGYTYKVITDHTDSDPVAKVGDTIISNGTIWVVIPSGDEPSGTVTSVGITNGGGISVSGSPITSSGSITVSHADTSSQASVTESNRTYIKSVTLDTYGHVTGLTTGTETVTDTNTTYALSNALSSHKFTETLTAGGSGSGTSTATMELGSSGVISLTDDTTNKKITIGISNANAHYVLAGPSTGSAVAPTFRQLSADEVSFDATQQVEHITNTDVNGALKDLDYAIDRVAQDLSSHTHTTTLATSTGTNQLTLEHGGKYALTAGGTSYIFTMPAAPTTSDTKVTNTLDTTTKYYMTGTTSSSTNTGTQIFDTGIYATTTAGQLNATTYKVNEQVTMQWNSTDSTLDFIFA